MKFAPAVVAAITLAALCATPSGVSAQETAASASVVETGSRVRFSINDVESPGGWAARRLFVRGTVAGIRGDSLDIRLGGNAALTTVSRSAIGDLSVSRGMQREFRAHPWRTAINGALLASTIALTIRTTHTAQRVGGRSAAPQILLAVPTAIIFSEVAFRNAERWERVRR